MTQPLFNIIASFFVSWLIITWMSISFWLISDFAWSWKVYSGVASFFVGLMVLAVISTEATRKEYYEQVRNILSW